MAHLTELLVRECRALNSCMIPRQWIKRGCGPVWAASRHMSGGLGKNYGKL